MNGKKIFAILSMLSVFLVSFVSFVLLVHHYNTLEDLRDGTNSALTDQYPHYFRSRNGLIFCDAILTIFSLMTLGILNKLKLKKISIQIFLFLILIIIFCRTILSVILITDPHEDYVDQMKYVEDVSKKLGVHSDYISSWVSSYYAQIPITIIDILFGLSGSFLIHNILIGNNQDISQYFKI